MRNKEKDKSILRHTNNQILNSSIMGVGTMMIISLAFGLKVNLLTILWGIMLGGILFSFTSVVALDHLTQHMELQCEVDLLVAKGLDKHESKILELEKKVEELEKLRRH